MSEFYDDLEGNGGDVVPLEPLARSRGAGIGARARAIFDVLYDASEPLSVDEIAPRAFEKVHPAVHYHARRVYLRQLESHRQSARRRRVASVDSLTLATREDVSLERAWRWAVGASLAAARRHGTVLRDGDLYHPNPAKAPWLERADGTRVRYTRETWQEMSATDQATGDIQAMSLEVDRLWADLDADARRQAVALIARKYADERNEHRPDERTLRSHLLWLLRRPSTDEGRAWLLAEAVRRAYGPAS